MLKRLFDVFFALVGLVVFLPVLVVGAIWIKLDSPGPILFKQVRVGRLGREFKIYKFRTMVVNAESLGKQITIGEDRRITASGKWLRKFKFDEVPQIFNVLKGDMSLVGPRPEVPNYVKMYAPEQRRVLEVRPGITDLASIEFRRESDLLAQFADPEYAYIHEIMPKKLAMNLQYIDRANLVTDFSIIMQTLYKVMTD
jgi:lipopolysaccharide/colanic/teichoic acid biosynthesis glycosyltransferase